MAPVRPKKRGSDQSIASTKGHTMNSKVPLKSSPSTPRHKNPFKKQRVGVSVQQKQALIDNLQLEVTERARRLRAQYNLQAQGLRSRIEIRINRIPTSLRKVKMGDLLLKYIEQEQNRVAGGRPPPVPAKDTPKLDQQQSTYAASRTQAFARSYKGVSNEPAGDKENEVENMDQKRKAHGAQGTDSGNVRPAQVLSPTSSNSRLANRSRPASPTKSQIARPGSPLKSSGVSRSAAVTSVFSSMVERAKATRHGGARKATTTSEASSSSNNATATGTKARRPVAASATASKGPPSRPATRTGRRASGTSETSEASTGTVVRKAGAAKTAPATKKVTTMGTIRKGVTGGAKKLTAKPAAAPASSSAGGRVLRKRG